MRRMERVRALGARCVVLGCCVAALSVWAGCSSDPPVAEVREPVALAEGQSRVVELASVRFDVLGYAQTLDRDDLLALPEDVRARLWLLDLDLVGGPNAPRLVDNALEAITALDPATLDPASANMQRLLTMTPDTVDVTGTQLEGLVELSGLLGIAPERVLADLLQIDPEATFLAPGEVASAVVEQVIATHPAAQQRLGPRTADNPDGVYPVRPGAVPITLEDALTDFASFGERFGPVWSEGGVYHPGFVVPGGVDARVLTEDFRITVRANANALPYQGVDLTNGGAASVNSVPSQIEGLFDFEDPSWLTLEGLVEGSPRITRMEMRLVESERFVSGGRSSIPVGQGDSAAWRLPPWTLERVLVGAAQRAYRDKNADVRYLLPDRERPVFEATVREGWKVMRVEADLGSPPPASYLWDDLLEIAQVRLHDGGLAEGEANAAFVLEDVPVGIDAATLERTLRANLEANPGALVDVAAELIDSTRGAADVYYYRARESNGPETRGDWLVFVGPDDMGRAEDGTPARPYSYAKPGFYGDAELTEKVSSAVRVDGDAVREKVRVRGGETLYVEDDEGAVFALEVLDKPSLGRLRLRVTRAR